MEWAFSDSADSSLSLLAPSPNIRGASFPPATEQDFELYVYAALQCGGWFVEPNPKEHDLDNIELFEIDAVARKPFAVEGQRILAVEAKSGAWGGRDVLLVVGRGAGLPRVFRTADMESVHAAACVFRSSSRTSCGVR
jgi:hypothetical protein